MSVAMSLVLPCYNEAQSLGAIVERFASCNPASRGFELVLVDNGSSDQTGKTIAELQKKYGFVKMVKIEKNIGYGNGIWQGLQASSGQFVCWSHADMQTDPLDSVRAYAIISKEANPKMCFVKGSRQNRPPSDAFFSLGMSAFAALALGGWLMDINAQPNMFHRSFLAKLHNPPLDFSFDLFALCTASKSGLRIIRFPVDFSKRAHGASHWNTGLLSKWKFIRRTASFTLQLRSRLKKAV